MKKIALNMLLSLLLVSCANTVNYRSDAVVDAGAVEPVTYRLVLHGATNANDLETVAFLDREDDGWEISPVSPAFNFKVQKGMSAGPAIAKARDFVAFHPDFDKSEIRRVLDGNGKVVCYEVRPLYHHLRFGMSDILGITYVPNEQQTVMKTYIRVDSSVLEKMDPTRGRGGGR